MFNHLVESQSRLIVIQVLDIIFIAFNQWLILIMCLILLEMAVNALIDRFGHAFGHALLALKLNEYVLLFSRGEKVA